MNEPAFSLDEFEEKLTTAVRMPEPDPAYVDRLFKDLQSSSPVGAVGPSQRSWWRSPVSALAGIAAVVLMAAFVVTGPQKVLAAVQTWLGAYIPSFGFVDDAGGVRMISEPVRQERDGGVMTVDAAFTDSTRTIVVIGESHTSVPCPRLSDQMEDPYLMAGSTRLALDGWKASRLIFPPLPAGVDDAVLHMPWMLFCEADVLDWEIPLHFEPAPQNVVMPVLESEVPVQTELVPTQAVEQTGITPAQSGEAILELGQVVALEDGIQLSGLLRWQSPDAWYSLPPAEEITVQDADGRSLPVQPLLPEEVATLYAALPANSTPWAFRISGKDHPGSLTLSVPYLLRTVSPASPVQFELDFGSGSQPGQTWAPDLSISFAGHDLTLVEVRQVDDEGKVLQFTFESDKAVEFVTAADAAEPAGGGGGTGEYSAQPGQVKFTAYFNSPVITGQHSFNLISLEERLAGPWQVTWQAPLTEP